MTQTRERGPAGEGLVVTLSDLHAANKARQTEWCVGGDPEPDLAFRGNELAGETGEACNVIKKLERERHGWRGSRATLDDLAQELADVIICTDLCAITAGIDLAAAVVAKFNATSEKQGLATKLDPASQAAPVAGVEGDDNARLVEYLEGRLEHYIDEAQRLALLVRKLGGDPEPSAPPPPGDAERLDLGELERLSAKAPKGTWYPDEYEAHDEDGGPSEIACDGIVTHDDGDDAGSIASCTRRVAEFVCRLVNDFRENKLVEASARETEIEALRDQLRDAQEIAHYHRQQFETLDGEYGRLVRQSSVLASRPDGKGGGDQSGPADLVSYLHRQWGWSKETFGPALRTKGIIQHITKELREIEAEPHDLAEWVDVIILAMDGFWRHGGKPEDLLPAMQAKQDKNFARAWPDWRTMGEDQAIEHDRTEEKRLAALVAAKAAEPVFQELAARLDANINWPRYLPVIKEGPTGVSAWQVILPGGRLINLSDEEWQAAVDLGGPPRPAPCDEPPKGEDAHSAAEGQSPASAVPEGQAPTPDPVGEAKALLEGLGAWVDPEKHISRLRDHALAMPVGPERDFVWGRAAAYDAALATIRSSQAGEVRDDG